MRNFGTVEVLVDGNWHHICFTYDATAMANPDAQIYIDGVLDGGSSPSGLSQIDFHAKLTVEIGDARPGFLSDFSDFTGYVSDVVVFSSILSDAQIADLAQTCYTINGDLISWIADEISTFGDVSFYSPSTCPYHGTDTENHCLRRMTKREWELITSAVKDVHEKTTINKKHLNDLTHPEGTTDYPY